MKSTRLHILTTAAVCCATMQASAYTYVKYLGSPVTWSSGSMNLRAHQGSFPPSGERRAALEEAVDAWNRNPSQFQFNLVFGDVTVGRKNFQNEIWFTDDEDILDYADARTLLWYPLGSFMEVDIVLRDKNNFWTTAHNPLPNYAYGGGRRPMQTAMLHEMGHALGLAHEDDEYNIMGQDWTHLNVHSKTAHYYPGEDACDGAVYLYGLDSTHTLREDVSVTHWMYWGSDGTYSIHTRTKVFRADGTEADRKADSDDDPVYRVTKGHTVRMQLTLENSGASDYGPVYVRYYLSEDDALDATDDLLASTTSTTPLERGRVRTTDGTSSQDLVIPTSVTSGKTYYLLAVIDPSDKLDEVNEDNNITYVKIEIK